MVVLWVVVLGLAEWSWMQSRAEAQVCVSAWEGWGEVVVSEVRVDGG